MRLPMLLLSTSKAIRPAARRAVTRFKSTSVGIGAMDAPKQSAECPVTGAKSTREQGASALGTTMAGQPMFHKVPAFPVVGSLVPQLSGVPMTLNYETMYDFWPSMRQKFGEFYQMGLPVVGSGINGELVVLHDPIVMMGMLRKEGVYPSGAAQSQWAVREILTEIGLGALAGIFSQGPEWKRVRMFLQTDLLGPKSANRFVPSILTAAESASKAAMHYQDDFKQFLDNASFQMFYSIMFGTICDVVDPTKERDAAGLEFAEKVALALSISQELNRSMAAKFLKASLGYETSQYSKAKEYWEASIRISSNMVTEFLARREKGELTPGEEDSYLNQAFIRQGEEGEKGLTLEEVKLACAGLLSAGVDTTSNMMTWYFVHAALNPEIQGRLREELKANLVDGRLSPDSFSSSSTPLLMAFTRESHRVTPSITTNVFRNIPDPFTLHGRDFPSGTTICFDGYSKGMDPSLVDDPMTFDIDRWLPEQVQKRQGTPSEVLDHPLFSGPFSQGARRCPGSRVARNEGHILLAQLILDWEMTIPTVSHWKEVPIGQATLTIPKPMPRIEMKPLFA